MGMYDELHIDKKHLPDNLKSNETGWQTKSLYCSLSRIKITDEGKLMSSKYLRDKFEHVNYTGEVRFYDIINNTQIEYVAFFENGQLFKIIQI